MTSHALELPLFDPGRSIRALVTEWVLPALGGILRFVTAPFVAGIVAESVAMLEARSVADLDRIAADADRRNRRRAYPFFAALLAGTTLSPTVSETYALRQLRAFYEWWDREARRSNAPDELRETFDTALYSLCRSVPKLPKRKYWPVDFAVGMSAVQIILTAMMAVFLSGGESVQRRVDPAVATALVDRAVVLADAFSRYVARADP
jgi:hypothetical protein